MADHDRGARGAAGLLAIGGDHVIRKGSQQREETWTADCVHRVAAAAQAEAESLVRSGRDYAIWTDTYEFMAGGGRSYIENNLLPAGDVWEPADRRVSVGTMGQHRGTIGMASEVDRGTTIILHLPLAADQPVGTRGATPGGATGRVRLIDDDDLVRETLAAGLRRAGYEVVRAGSGPEALELIRRDPGRFDALITDQMMPGMTGIELGQQLVAEGRRLRMILITGYAAALNEPKVKAMGFAAMLLKPVTIDDLDRVLRTTAPSSGRGSLSPGGRVFKIVPGANSRRSRAGPQRSARPPA